MAASRSLSVLDLSAHALHVALPLALLLCAEPRWLEVVAAALLFFGLFTLHHDAMHSSLGLSRGSNAVLLSLSTALLAGSGHAGRRRHFHHHASPLDAGDVETASGERALLRVLWRGLCDGLGAPLDSLRNPRALRRELAEWLLVVALLALAFASRRAGPVVYASVALGLRCSMPLWAGLVPHRPPAWLLALARPLHGSYLPMFTALLDHAEHHAHPRLPTYSLTRRVRARRLRTGAALAPQLL